MPQITRNRCYRPSNMGWFSIVLTTLLDIVGKNETMTNKFTNDGCGMQMQTHSDFFFPPSNVWECFTVRIVEKMVCDVNMVWWLHFRWVDSL